MNEICHSRPTGIQRRMSTVMFGMVLLGLAGCAETPIAEAERDCSRPGTWRDPVNGRALATEQLVATMAERPVVLLGEAHTAAEHHRWQLQMLAALHGRKSNMVIGFESFPRRVQPVLDQWVNGELDAAAFLESVEWGKVWGYNASFYMPLFHFARENRLQMIALNVDRELVARVGEEGWEAVPADERAGLSDPAPASEAYRKRLAGIYHFKQSMQAGEEPKTEIEDADIEAVMETEEFERFVEAQLTWDRAMAEALADAHREQPEALVVGIMGRGHVEHRYGVPHQLADLGLPDAAALLPVDPVEDCADLPTDLADAVFVVEPAARIEKPRPRARLGIFIEEVEDGVRVKEVTAESVAAATGIEAGDIVVSAAGFPVAKNSELIGIVQRQAPGTWLPLTVRRNGRETDLVAKFPTSFESPH
jgi:uncharacterized iron-regulated protein